MYLQGVSDSPKTRKVIQDTHPTPEALKSIEDAIERLALEAAEVDSDLETLSGFKLEQTFSITMINIVGVFQRRFKFGAEVDLVPGLRLAYRRSGNPSHPSWGFEIIEGERRCSLQFAKADHRTLAIDALPRLWEACEAKLQEERRRLQQDTSKARLFLDHIRDLIATPPAPSTIT